MKKISLSILLALACISSIFAFSACDENHTCSFDYQIPSKTFMVQEATCTQDSSYYSVCKCGNTSDYVYSLNDRLPHVYDNEIVGYNNLVSYATCESPAIYYKTCNCGNWGGETFTYGDALEHSFKNAIATDKYLKSEPSYVTRAEYYYSCSSCGAKGEYTFEGDYLVAEGSDGLGFELSSDGEYYILTSVAGVCDKTLVIPVAYDGKYVKEISINTNDITNVAIMTVVIPETITSISVDSFKTCKKLCEVINHSEVDILTGGVDLYIASSVALIHSEDASQLMSKDGCTYYVDDMGYTNLVDLDTYYYTADNVLTLPNTINGSKYRIRPYSVTCYGRSSIIIPDNSVLSICSTAFSIDTLDYIVLAADIEIIESTFLSNSYGTTYILCKSNADGDEWFSDWNSQNRTVFYGYTGNEITYYFFSESNVINTITSAYPIALPTPTSSTYAFNYWYIDQLDDQMPVSTLDGLYYASSADSSINLYAMWGDIVRDGLTTQTAYLISVGESSYVSINSGYRYYEFTAESSGYFTFYSTGSYDTRAYFYDENGSQFNSDDDSGSGYNFQKQIYLEAGEKIYVRVQQYGQGSASFYFYVSY